MPVNAAHRECQPTSAGTQKRCPAAACSPQHPCLPASCTQQLGPAQAPAEPRGAACCEGRTGRNNCGQQAVSAPGAAGRVSSCWTAWLAAWRGLLLWKGGARQASIGSVAAATMRLAAGITSVAAGWRRGRARGGGGRAAVGWQSPALSPVVPAQELHGRLGPILLQPAGHQPGGVRGAHGQRLGGLLWAHSLGGGRRLGQRARLAPPSNLAAMWGRGAGEAVSRAKGAGVYCTAANYSRRQTLCMPMICAKQLPRYSTCNPCATQPNARGDASRAVAPNQTPHRSTQLATPC